MSEFRRESRRDELRIPDYTSDKFSQKTDSSQPHQTRKDNNSSATPAELLNRKILNIKRIIKDKFPELSKFLDEIPLSIEDSSLSEISYHDLDEYYRSLEAVLNKYKLEYPDR